MAVTGVPAAAAAAAIRPGPGRGEAAPAFKNEVTFIGDSVTAGFGYCGTAENARNVSCRVNEPMADRWYVGDNNLKDCAPPDPPALPNDACSNDNDNGRPWNAGPWKPGSSAPDTAYPYQIAASQSPDRPAAVSDWAITGSTPANWDPDGGVYADQVRKLSDQYVVMTLGANPLLSYFTNITFPILSTFDVSGPCVGSTGYSEGWFSPDWYAGPLSRPVDCLKREWGTLRQGQHLLSLYKTLLSQNDRVIVLGYYRDCPWSFGNWQPGANISGPASGGNCRDRQRPVGPGDPKVVSQWDQALAVSSALNTEIYQVVREAREWARARWPGTDRWKDIAWTLTDQAVWGQHQAWDRDSWIFRNDTWIHPSRAGAAQLARTVTHAVCVNYAHWCGTTPTWG